MAYAWNSVVSNLSVINAGGSNYYLKDAEARGAIDSIEATVSGVMHWRGVTTTALTDGATTNPIEIGGEQYPAVAGDVVGYTPSGKTQREFAFNGTSWQEFGSTGALKAFAFVDTGSVTFTPSVSLGTLTVEQGTVSASGSLTTIDGVSFPSFSAPLVAAIETTTSPSFITGIDSAVKVSVSGETLTFTEATPASSTVTVVTSVNSVVSTVELGSASYTSTSKEISVSGNTSGVALSGALDVKSQTETVNPFTGS